MRVTTWSVEHYVISIWLQIWIWIHLCIISYMETLHRVYIHMECQSTWSVETLHTL